MGTGKDLDLNLGPSARKKDDAHCTTADVDDEKHSATNIYLTATQCLEWPRGLSIVHADNLNPFAR